MSGLRPAPDPLYVLRSPLQSPVTAVKLRPNATVTAIPELVSGNAAGIVELWDLRRRRISRSLNIHNGTGILGVDFWNGRLLSQGRDERLIVTDVAEGRCETLTCIPVDSPTFCRFDVDFETVAVPSDTSGEIRLHRVGSGERIGRLVAPRPTGMVMCLRFGEGTTLLFAGYEDGSIIAWDRRRGDQPVASIEKLHSEPVMCLDVGDDLKGCMGSADAQLTSWRLEGESLTVDKREEVTNDGLSACRIRGDKKLVATGGWDHRIRLWSWKSLKKLAVLSFHTGNVQSLDFDGDGLLAAGSQDSRISLWDVYRS